MRHREHKLFLANVESSVSLFMFSVAPSLLLSRVVVVLPCCVSRNWKGTWISTKLSRLSSALFMSKIFNSFVYVVKSMRGRLPGPGHTRATRFHFHNTGIFTFQRSIFYFCTLDYSSTVKRVPQKGYRKLSKISSREATPSAKILFPDTTALQDCFPTPSLVKFRPPWPW